ncbi:hypothetical protein JKF63_05483 [Porcisia hertigi]|uniref:PCIF1 WW domain-containing protein n=1 Tax=Porcisia hertigi TaxID=2761500 RepID=A0A836HYT8_9TRYP|nr:hypothetical protein JKF63_05483 [Porcisia hertigi]
MDVRITRDGVPEVFERDRVTLVMQQALTHRYADPLSSPVSNGVCNGCLVGTERGSIATSDMSILSPSFKPRLTWPLHYTLRPCSRTEYFFRFISSHLDTCADSVRQSAARGLPAVSTPWQSWDDEVSVAIAVAAECWRHTAFTELTQTDLHQLCRLPEDAAASTSGRRQDTSSSPPPLSATSATSPRCCTSPLLVSRQEFCEMPPRWVMQSLGEVDQHRFQSFDEWLHRRRVTPLDVGATIVMQKTGAVEAALPATFSTSGTAAQKAAAARMYFPEQRVTDRGGDAPQSSSSPSCMSASSSEVRHVLHLQERFRVLATGGMAHGAYWVNVAPLPTEEERVTESPGTATTDVAKIVSDNVFCERVDRDAVQLHPPAELHVDPLLPCDELYSERGVNTGVYVFFLRALQRQQRGLGSGRRYCRTAASDRDIGGSGRLPGGVEDGSSQFETAAALAVQLSLCARRRRSELAQRIDRVITAAKSSSLLQCARSREAATLSGAEDTAFISPKCSRLTTPTVLLHVRVDFARGSLQFRALADEGAADSTIDRPNSKFDASAHAAVSTLSTPPRCCMQDTGVSRTPHTKRQREDVEGEDNSAGRGMHRTATNPVTQSPTVEVLLRTAWKLAALYDMTRCPVPAQRKADQSTSEGYTVSSAHDREGAETLASPPMSPSTRMAVSLLTRLAGTSQALSGLAALGGYGPPSEASCGSEWSTVVLLQGDANLPSTVQVANEIVSSADPSARLSDCPIVASAPSSFSDGDPPAGVPGTTALVSTAPLTAITTTAAERIFLARLFRLLLRYRTLFGEHGYNQGPQAAVPPPVMEQLAATFEISAEAFASPLNAQLPQFCSLFPDTDVYFGSLGSFFDLQFGGAGGDTHVLRSPTSTGCTATPLPGCHFEVNPPFDTTLLRHMATHLLSGLERAQESSQSLLFLIVLPTHDMTDAERAAAAMGTQLTATRKPARSRAAMRLSNDALRGGDTVAASTPVTPSTERVLRESSYCLAHVLCAASESAYVDGHQHLLQCPFFRIETPTRLILLGNAAARARFPHAAAQLASVREAWKTLTESVLR